MNVFRMSALLALALGIPMLSWGSGLPAFDPSVRHDVDAWSAAGNMPIPVANASAAVVRKGKIYIVGGLDVNDASIADVQVYDPRSNTWAAGVPLPNGLSGGVGAVVNDKLYVFGGTNPDVLYSTTTWMFNFNSGTWTQRAPLPVGMRDGGAAVVGGTVFVVGGNTEADLRSPVVESYDPLTDTWSLGNPSLAVGRSELSVGVVGSTIIAVDGYVEGGVIGDNETLGIGDSQWTERALDPTARSAACAGAVAGGFYVTGGVGLKVTAHTHVYKVKAGKWRLDLAPMPLPVAWASGVVSAGKLYCFGGQTQFLEADTVVGNVQVYTP